VKPAIVAKACEDERRVASAAQAFSDLLQCHQPFGIGGFRPGVSELVKPKSFRQVGRNPFNVGHNDLAYYMG
jgi:hypothetical protein